MNQSIQKILTRDSVVLITGGGKGITAKSAIEIAKTAQCKLILVGRSTQLESEPAWAAANTTEKNLKISALAYFNDKNQKISPKQLDKEIRRILSDREIQSTLVQIEKAGAAVKYLPADVTDQKSLAAALDQAQSEFGNITGVIHGAGNLADKRIEQKSGVDFDIVVNTKIIGLQNILQSVDMASLKFLVLFSSVAGFYGNSGQADYAIANEILNKSAYRIQQSFPECRVLTINWGPWDSGMVSPRLKKFFEAQNIPLIPSEKGVKVLVDALTKENTETQIIVGSRLNFPIQREPSKFEDVTVHRVIAHSENPFLDDHRLGSQAVLPATCASTWLVDSCLALHPGYVFTALNDLKILKGLTFDTDEHACDINIKAIDDPGGGSRSYAVQISSQNENNRRVFHYSGNVTIAEKSLAVPVGKSITALGFNGNAIKPGEELYRDGTLFHGPVFQGIQEVLEISDDRVITNVSLPEMDIATQGQFTVRNANPYINDAVVQSMLVWSQSFYDAPCLPSRLHQWNNYRTPEFGQDLYVILDVTYHNENAVIGNLHVQDRDGRAFYTFVGLEGTISKHLKRFFINKALAAA